MKLTIPELFNSRLLRPVYTSKTESDLDWIQSTLGTDRPYAYMTSCGSGPVMACYPTYFCTIFKVDPA